MRRPDEERFWLNVASREPGECWLWTGVLNRNGYGRFSVGGHRRVAHRWLYQSLNGSLPEGIQLDHVCRVRRCVNPAHLDPVTPQVNNQRAARTGRRSTATRCVNGHAFDLANTYLHTRKTDGYTRRGCRACDRNRKARRPALGR